MPVSDLMTLLPKYDSEQAAENERKHAAKLERAAEQWQARTRRLAVDQSGLSVPSEDVHRVLGGDLASTDCLRHVERWWSSRTRLLMLCGGVGVGKTLAALWAAVRRADDAWDESPPAEYDLLEWADGVSRRQPRVSVAGATAVDLARRIAPWKGDGERVNANASLFIVDDLGTEQASDRWREAWQQLIDARMSAQRTLVTTNLRRAEIRQRYGDRIADRLNHIGRAIEVQGESMRRKGDL